VTKKVPPSKPSTRFATTLSIIAIVLSLSSWLLNYASSLPTISPKVELVEPIALGKEIHFRVLLENTGKATAKHMRPMLAAKFSRADVPFEATFDEGVQTSLETTTSDLIPGGHATLLSTNPLSLAHEHDVNAVLSGSWHLYLYGRIPYKDILHVSHEVHFCGYYRQVPGAEPLKLTVCPSYNETD